MPTEPAIVVRRQLVDVAVGGTERDGSAAQRHLSGRVSDVVASSLIAAFRTLDLGDDHLVVERLTVDVAPVGIAGLDDAIADALRREVEELIRRHVPTTSAAVDEVSVDGPVTRRSAVRSTVDAFVEFLATGRLPWGFDPGSGGDIETAVRSAWEREHRDGGPAGWPAVREALGDARSRDRLVRQFSEPFAVDVVRRVDAGVGSALAAALATSSAPGRRAVAGERSSAPGEEFLAAWRRALLAAAVDSAVAGDSTDEPALAGSAWAGLDPTYRAAPDAPAWLGERWPGLEVARAEATAGGPGARHPVDVVPEEAAARPAAPAKGSLDPDGWPVDHAGIVLLHPFLPRLFEGLGLCDDADRLADAGRAVGLLYHLATGAERVPEHETTVAKVLCGVPLDDPVEGDPVFTLEELDEAEALVDAVIRHWDALGRTSPAALRAEFLSRPGLLAVDTSGDWLLRVEQRTVDVLLGQLPWGISMVSTPWMDRLMRVEWGP